jgi:transposase
MKQDGEIKLLLNERRKGTKQKLAAARAGMSERTARKYEHAGKLPSELNKPRIHRTRPNPFEQDWPWFTGELKRDPALQAKTLFVLINQTYPGRYQEGQLRTLQRQISAWRIQHGPEQEIMFQQEHIPGRMAQSDFTEMNSLGITLGGEAFPHLVFHMVLTYSNIEAIKVCFSESFAALSEGMEGCLGKIGGAPLYHRTDNLSAAVSGLDEEGRHKFTKDYQAVLSHYGMKPSANTAGCANQNGDVEQSHFRFKSAVDQELRVRGSRDFSSRAIYESFLEALVRNRNLTRTARFEEERQVLQPLPAKPLCLTREVTVHVSRFSLIRVDNNTYSVPSRLIGADIKVRIHAETLDLYHVATQVLSLPRLMGRNKHRIDYRHLIWSLVRKPGAFANYCYREELFPTTVFRRAYDALVVAIPAKADSAYLRILHLAASTSESDVQLAITLLQEDGKVPTFEAIRDLAGEVKPVQPPAIGKKVIDLRCYDALIPSRGQHA